MSRDIKIDGLKGFLIFCVVLGHMSFYDYGLQLIRMIYSFHMPVFVFLSGYLTPISPTPEKKNNWLKQTLCIYVIAQLLHTCLKWVLNEPVSLRVLISPAFTLWYLICLVYWRLSAWTIFKGIPGYWLVTISFILAFVSGFVPIDQDLSFQRAFSFLPFFVLGLVSKKKDILPSLEKVPIWIAFIFLTLGLFIARHLPTFQPKYHYSSLHDIELRLIQVFLGVLLCYSLLRISRLSVFSFLARYGRYSLWIYIGQSFLTRVNVLEKALSHYYGIESNLWIALTITSLYCIVIGMIADLYYRNRTTP